VQAITSGGMTAWTANVGTSVGPSNLIPDFQGGSVVASGQSIYRLDGMTGTQSTWTYNSVSGSYLPTPVVHTDGTIFTVDGNAVVGINPATGSNFSVAMEATTNNGAPVSSPPGPSSIGNLIIAGDGYAYVPYQYSQGSSAETQTVSTGSSTSYLNLLRVGSDGNSTEISVKQWSQSSSSVSTAGGYIPFLTPYSEIIFGAVLNTYCGSLGGCPTEVTETFFSSYSGASGLPSLLTNADQGVLLSFQAVEGSQSQTTDVWCYAPGCPNEIPSELTSSTSSYNNGATNSYLATIASGGGVSLAMLNLPGQSGPIQPVLQRADGSYVGTAYTSGGNLMMAFTPSGSTLWTVPNDTARIAIADGGVIGASGTTYKQNGTPDGQLASMLTQSWTGTQYQVGSGSIQQMAAPPIQPAGSFWPFVTANVSANSTAGLKETLYIRSFAPWLWFGIEPPPFLCSNNCFRGDDRSFTTSLSVTSRISAKVTFLLPGMSIIAATATSSPSIDIYGRQKTAVDTINAIGGNGGLQINYSGANPLIIPQSLSPNIDVNLDMSAQTSPGQVCYTGNFYGDAFPNAEVFTINSQNQSTMLLNFTTAGSPNGGPIHYLPGDGTSNMGKFSNVCVIP
jgi:hypothetical protein